MKLLLASSFLLGCFLSVDPSDAFQGGPRVSKPLSSDRLVNKEQVGRRDFLSQVAFVGSVLVATPPPALAEEAEDLASRLYNADGSLREDVEKEAKARTVEFAWDPSEPLLQNVDGVNNGSTRPGSKVKVTYELPEKWSTGTGAEALYFDKSEGVNARALDRIAVYQAPGTVQIDQLEKASKIGVAKALQITDDLRDVASADLIGGRTAKKQDDQKYFEFDMAVAPASCDSSKENLGLGFCPYESIYLMSATVLQDKLYVISLKCNKSEWKQASSDLKRVRSSFAVTMA